MNDLHFSSNWRLFYSQNDAVHEYLFFLFIYLGAGDDGVCVHNPVRIFFSDLGDKQGSHSRASTASKRVCKLEALQTIAAFRLLPHDVQNGVDKFSALGVVALSPVVAGAALSKNEVVRSEDLSIRSRADGIHGAGLQIDQDCPRHVF
jgi:hypothetical protein